MQKLPVVFLFVYFFFLSACNFTSPRDDIGIPRQISTAEESEAQDLNVAKSSEKSDPNSVISESGEPLTTQETDLWKRIGSGLTLTRNISEKTTASKLAWFTRNQAYLDRVSTRAKPYLYYIVEELEKRNMPLDLALLPIVESAYNPFAYSPSRASGIWQFIPGTGKKYGLTQNWWYDGRRDIVTATGAALNYLQKLHQEFNGDWLLALAAYNSGEGNVGKAIRRNKKAGKPTDFFSLRLPRETRGYVPSLLAVAEIVSNPGKYKITLKPIANTRYFKQVDINSQIDLATAAELSELSIEELYTLNPGFNRWATDPKGPHLLLIPVDKASEFENKLASLTSDDRIKWQQHKIQKGESLGRIATRYRTDVATLKQINRLKSNTIHTGRSLLIPAAQKPLKHYSLSLDSRRYKGLKRSGDGQRYVYTIKRGDNLWDIGRHYGISVKQLCAWNAISSKSILRPGKKLEIWVEDETDKTAKVIPVVSKKSIAGDSQHISYQVLEGDSLWLISQRFGVPVDQIKKWNNLAKKRYIKPGQLLDIYTGTPPKGA
ncbi:MAG: LysM peptidoglycan-binding domain-containing protein [Proteobacteria bacterium]|nr:LysM peptidoglycan-binding domain-containing protein [Pseudomonadota bacterium]